MTPKTLTVTFILPEETNPGNEQQLHEVVRNFLAPKGVKLEEDNTVDLR